MLKEMMRSPRRIEARSPIEEHILNAIDVQLRRIIRERKSVMDQS